VQLQKHYAYVNELLQESGAKSCWIAFDLKRTSTTECSVDLADCMGISDALFFGHIATVMQDTTIGPIIVEYEGIMMYFKHICRTYFSSKNPLYPSWQAIISVLYDLNTTCNEVNPINRFKQMLCWRSIID